MISLTWSCEKEEIIESLGNVGIWESHGEPEGRRFLGPEDSGGYRYNGLGIVWLNIFFLYLSVNLNAVLEDTG